MKNITDYQAYNLKNETIRTKQLELLIINTKDLNLIKKAFYNSKLAVKYEAIEEYNDLKEKYSYKSLWGKNAKIVNKSRPLLNYYIKYSDIDFDIDLSKNGYDIFIYKHKSFIHNGKEINVVF